MTLVESLVLFIGLSTSAVAIAAALKAMRHGAQAERASKRLTDVRARMTDVETLLDSLYKSHKKLSGTYYRERRRDVRDDDGEEEIATHVQANGAAACENYAIAQREGPTSRAAQCECDYCSARRVGRSIARAQVSTIRSFKGINDGEE